MNFPCITNIKIVPISQVEANNYNPNVVAKSELRLLEESIKQDGMTQPIVVFYDKERDKYIIIDGFHRYTILKDCIKSNTVPICIIDKPLDERIASTIPHNRARGEHQTQIISKIVENLQIEGWQEKDFIRKLGMSNEEIFRLTRHKNIADSYANTGFGYGWKIDK